MSLETTLAPQHAHADSGGRASRVRLSLLALALGGFAIGTTEFVSMGVLDHIAADVHVSIPTAGRLISAYALGVVVGAPLFGNPSTTPIGSRPARPATKPPYNRKKACYTNAIPNLTAKTGPAF